uniref:Uncharacterized protein n=1 Tax=Panagrolaimus davidi TaxID=227884 RepID=A0A914PI99_9BILA
MVFFTSEELAYCFTDKDKKAKCNACRLTIPYEEASKRFLHDPTVGHHSSCGESKDDVMKEQNRRFFLLTIDGEDSQSRNAKKLLESYLIQYEHKHGKLDENEKRKESKNMKSRIDRVTHKAPEKDKLSKIDKMFHLINDSIGDDADLELERTMDLLVINVVSLMTFKIE